MFTNNTILVNKDTKQNLIFALKYSWVLVEHWPLEVLKICSVYVWSMKDLKSWQSQLVQVPDMKIWPKQLSRAAFWREDLYAWFDHCRFKHYRLHFHIHSLIALLTLPPYLSKELVQIALLVHIQPYEVMEWGSFHAILFFPLPSLSASPLPAVKAMLRKEQPCSAVKFWFLK